MAAEKNKLLFLCQLLGDLLGKGPSLGRHIDHPGLMANTVTESRIGTVNGLRLHDHSGSPAVGVVVHLSMALQGIVADVNGLEGQKPAGGGPPQDTGIQPVHDHLRKQCHYMKIHGLPPLQIQETVQHMNQHLLLFQIYV